MRGMNGDAPHTAIFLNSPSVCCWQRREGQAHVLLCLAGFSCLKEKSVYGGEDVAEKHLYIKQLLSESPHTEIKRMCEEICPSKDPSANLSLLRK